MKIPSHWSKATAEGSDRKGRPLSFSCWRPSDRSPEDAHESALSAAKKTVDRLAGGERLSHYPYGEVPLREEVLQRFTDSQGGLCAAVTRNGYGSLVLNAARVLFIDWDFPPVPIWEYLKLSVVRFFNRSAATLRVSRWENDVRSRLEQFLTENPRWGIRVYRTFAGLRGLVTHDLFEPAAESTLAVLRSVGADPMYVRLCKVQECFRARLTPKPWRCGHYVNRTGWPRDGGDQQQRFEQWLSTYMARQAGYATCRYLETIGNSTIHPEIGTIIEVHDKITRCHEAADLA